MKKAPFVVASILIAALVATGIGKVKRAKPIRHNLRAVDVPRKWWNPMAVVEFLGAAGLIIGLVFPPLGILAAVGVMLYFAGAVVAHIRTRDPNVVPSGLFMVLSGYMVKLMIDRDQGGGTEPYSSEPPSTHSPSSSL